MTRSGSLLLILLLPSCATLGLGRGDGGMDELWRNAHTAFAQERFADAERGFRRVAAEFPERREGREALFYLGSLQMDPRNPKWEPDSAAVSLRRYLERDSVAAPHTLRRPEALVLMEIANQLNLPPDQRVPELQPRTRVVTRAPAPGRAPTQAAPPPLRVAPAAEAAAEIERLRRQLGEREKVIAARDDEIRRLREEIERIRKTLVPQRP
ncbi:hypothetical protein BH23GEM5_BH23GEM5_03350 [soil metagenome]